MHIHVKSKIKWGNRYKLFSIFFIENQLFKENVEKGVCGNEPNGRTVQHTQLIHISIEAESRDLQNYREVFFSNFTLDFELYIFFQKNSFLPKKLKFQTVYFLSELENEKKTLCNFVDHKIPRLF